MFTLTMPLVPTIIMGTGTSLAYEEISVTEGGTLTGRVTPKGDVLKPEDYNLATLPDAVYCGRNSTGTGGRRLQPFAIGPEGGFRNVVVFIQKVKQGKPFDYSPPLIEAIDWKFESYITVVRDRNTIKVDNKDPAFHDIQEYETSKRGARVLFNTPFLMSKRLRQKYFMDGKTVKNLAEKVLTQKIKMGRGRNLFVMQCGFHAYMESWAFVADYPDYALSPRMKPFRSRRFNPEITPSK